MAPFLKAVQLLVRFHAYDSILLGNQVIRKHLSADSIPTLFSILLTWKAISLPRDKPLPWPPGLDYSKFCPFHRYAGRTIEECNTLRDVIYDMNDEKSLNWNEVKAYLKATNVTEAAGDLY